MNRFLFFIFLIIGHFSATAQPIYVNKNAVGQNDGSSWQNAYTDLHDALNEAISEDAIWVAKGTYRPAWLDRNITFEIPSGIAFYGGFNGDETSINERDLDNNFTILSGDIGQISNSDDNSYTIAHLEYLEGDTTIFDGLFFEKGIAYPTPYWDCDDLLTCEGGGLNISGTVGNIPTYIQIRNCTFRGNSAKRGGGIFIDGTLGQLNVEIDNCRFESNGNLYIESSFEDAGGCIYILHEGDSIDVEKIEIKDCVFVNNNSTYSGGAIHYEQENAFDTLLVPPHFIVNSCTIEDSAADGDFGGQGGAITIFGWALSLGDIQIKNSNFISNYAGHNFETGAGGAIYDYCVGKGLLITNSIFRQNIASYGGAIATHTSAHTHIINAQFIQNGADFSGGAINGQNKLSFSNCLFFNNISGNNGGAIFNNYLDTNKFTCSNSTFYGNQALEKGGAFYMGGQNSTITNSIFWNNQSINTNVHSIGGLPDSLYIYNSIIDIDNCDSIDFDHPLATVFCENTYFNTYPNFTDTLNNDFSLQCNSVGIDNGTTVPSIFANIGTDIVGNPRISGDAIDIGAYEYTGFLLDTVLQNATSETSADGSIFLENIMGGTPPFTFLWSTGNTTSSLESVLPGDYEVTISDQTDCSEIFVFTITAPNSIINNKSKKEVISIFPNPVENRCTLTFTNPTSSSGSVQFFTLNGGKIGTINHFSKQTIYLDLSLADMPSGVYFLKIEMNNRTIYRKIIKQ